jgi:hypothetical protein
VDNIKIDIRELGSRDVKWIELAQNRIPWRDLDVKAINLTAA